jgi:DNA polymerase-3 subunit epsilon/CBS domain-containing protein
MGGLFPVFTAARVLSIKHGAMVRATPDRLRAVVAAGKASSEEAEGILEAHKEVLGAVLAQQIEDIEAGRRPGNLVDVSRLPRYKRRALLGALSTVSRAVDLVREGML